MEHLSYKSTKIGKKIPKALESLDIEARKYKTPEEFVRAQAKKIGIIKTFEELYPKPISSYSSEYEDAIYDFHDEADSVFYDLVYEYIEHENDPNYIQKWKLVPKAKVKKIWNDYAKLGFVRDEKGINQIADIVTTNIQKIGANNILCGHTSLNPEEEVKDKLEIEKPEEYFSEKIPYFFDDPNGNWRISDYAIDTLSNNAIQLKLVKTYEEKLLILDRIFNLVHPRSDLASWFIDGGSETLNELAGTVVEIKESSESINRQKLIDIWKKAHENNLKEKKSHSEEHLGWAQEHLK